jgi:hypothetical protein
VLVRNNAAFAILGARRRDIGVQRLGEKMIAAHLMMLAALLTLNPGIPAVKAAFGDDR